MNTVFVIDAEGKPLLPTHPARSRKLLRNGRATVEQVVPFTIRLKRKVENPVGSFVVGVDDGTKHVGIAVKNEKTDEIVFRGQMDLRQDVHLKMERRRNFRRARRFRLRNRQPRFNNRIGAKLVPSVKCRKDSILRLLADLGKRLNIVEVIVEEVKFNHAKHRYGKWFSLVEIGKKYLKNQIEKMGYLYTATFGYSTKSVREMAGLMKTHINDAIAIVIKCGMMPIIVSHCLEYNIKPRRTKTSSKRICTEKNGFRHYDLVRASHGTRGTVIGSVRSLKKTGLTLRTSWNDNFEVSYRKSVLLQRFGGLIYSW